MGVSFSYVDYPSACAAHKAQKEAIDRDIEAQRQAFETTGISKMELGVSKAAKCPSCGSHQFVMHANRRICSYCRSEG